MKHEAYHKVPRAALCRATVGRDAGTDAFAGDDAGDVADFFVIEHDDSNLTLDDQVKIFENSEIPYAMLVSSGNKSVHCAVVTDRNLNKLIISY